MATFEVFFYCINEAIVVEIFKIYDIGGSIVIHVFGAFFGLSVALFYHPEEAIADVNQQNQGNYLSDLISMVGSLFLFAYWPSFNAALGSGTAMHRAIINTYLTLACSVTMSIVMSKFTHGGKLNMEIVLNAALAGAVAVGSIADLIVTPAGGMIAGAITGSISALGFAYLSPFVKKHLRLHDTCGVLNLHGIPGVIGALISAILAYRAGDTFKDNLAVAYPIQAARAPAEQAGYQLAALGVCLSLAIGGGIFTGFVTTREFFKPIPTDSLFNDKFHFFECEIEHDELHKLKEIMKSGNTTSNTIVKQTSKVGNLVEEPEKQRLTAIN